MKSCSLYHWFLFFIILIPVADLTLTSLTAKLHHPVTLTCNQKCSGEMTWKMFNKPDDVLARCDQLSCQSQEGFEISHDQDLKGNLDLVIRSVDYSKRTIFTCYCEDKAVCNISLIIEPLVSAVHKKPGEDLVLDLHIPEPIEVVYKSKHAVGSKSELICFGYYGSLQCGTNYTQRASLSHTELTLRDLKVSDSGVYTIRDMKNKEVLHTYVVSVGVPKPDLAVPCLTAKLHQPVTLTCNQKCSGVMEWKTFNNYVVAQCGQKTCQSEEGFEISYDRYLNGTVALVIRSADYSKRTLYTCYCGDKPVCDVLLIIEPLVSAVQKKPGEDLVLNLTIPKPMEVDFKSKHSVLETSEWICTVNNGSLQCGADYNQRASLHHTELTLRDLKVSDSGVYIIRDMKNKEVLHTYVVSVEEESADWKTPTIVLISVAILLMVGVGVWLHRIKKENKDLKMENKSLKDSCSQLHTTAQEQSLVRTNGDTSQITDHTSGPE